MRGARLLRVFVASAALGLALSGIGRAGSPPTAALDRARLVVSAPVGNGFVAHVWRSPSTTGGECRFVTVDRVRAPVRPQATGGGGCSSRPGSTAVVVSHSAPLNVSFEITTRVPRIPARQWVPPIVDGVVYPGLHASEVRVEWRGGSHELALRDNQFVGGGGFLYSPAFRHLPYVVAAYDDSGRLVARRKLESPWLYPSLKGWKAFAPVYLRWKKANHG